MSTVYLLFGEGLHRDTPGVVLGVFSTQALAEQAMATTYSDGDLLSCFAQITVTPIGMNTLDHDYQPAVREAALADHAVFMAHESTCDALRKQRYAAADADYERAIAIVLAPFNRK